MGSGSQLGAGDEQERAQARKNTDLGPNPSCNSSIAESVKKSVGRYVKLFHIPQLRPPLQKIQERLLVTKFYVPSPLLIKTLALCFGYNTFATSCAVMCLRHVTNGEL